MGIQSASKVIQDFERHANLSSFTVCPHFILVYVKFKFSPVLVQFGPLWGHI